MRLNKDLRKLARIWFYTSFFLLTTAFAQSNGDNDNAMVHSADGRYTNDEKYILVQVHDSEISIKGTSLIYSGTLFNPGVESLKKIELIIDIYSAHPLIKKLSIPVHQCKKSLGMVLPPSKKISFSGVCTNLPNDIVASVKKHRISIGKL